MRHFWPLTTALALTLPTTAADAKRMPVPPADGSASVPTPTPDARGPGGKPDRPPSDRTGDKPRERDDRTSTDRAAPSGRPTMTVPGRGTPPPTWRTDRPVVSSFGPSTGRAGTKIVIRGRNFSPTFEVTWGQTTLTDATITPTTISFVVPAGATDGFIAVRSPTDRRAIAVGKFALADAAQAAAAAEAQATADAARKLAAEASWRKRAAAPSADRAVRDAALTARERALDSSRDERRGRWIDAQRERFAGNFLADDQTQAELTLHAERIAKLERMGRVAEAVADGDLGVRIEVATTREQMRHDSRMATLRDAFTQAGGQ